MEDQVGDRRNYFRAPENSWQIFQTLAQERKKREIDPTLSMLREAVMEPVTEDSDHYAQKRMRDMHDLIEFVTCWFPNAAYGSSNAKNAHENGYERTKSIGF